LDDLGLEPVDGSGLLSLRIGPARLTFTPSSAPQAEPFYHFALLVPGDRFNAAYEWLVNRARLLPDRKTGDVVFDFDNWDALACYCLDPGGNIVELIAHRGIGENAVEHSFSPAELLGISEIGFVGGNKVEIADILERALGLSVWDGEVDDIERLAFVGERGRTLILCPQGRPWLPTDRRAEAHRVELVVHGAKDGRVDLPQTPHRIIGRTDQEA
jgi:hypothetical protein